MNKGTEQLNSFRVEPAGADIAYKWLKTMDQAFEMMPPGLSSRTDSRMEEERDLPLGQLDIHNTLLHIIQPALFYLPGGYYEIRTGIVPAPQKSDNERNGMGFRQGPNFPFSGAMIIGSDGKELSGSGALPPEIQAIVNQLSSGGDMDNDVPVSLPILTEALQRRPNLAPYDVKFNRNQEEIRINPPQSLDEEVRDNVYTIQTRQTSRGQAYYLENLKAEIGDSPEAFATKFRLYARLVEDIVLAIYEAGYKQSPDAVLKFAPPDDTVAKLKKLEKFLTLGKRQLSAAGIIDDGDDEDIESKITMEKPDIRFTDVGGQEKAKIELSDVVFGLEHPEEFYAEGALPPNGVLLYGPSGTGKTLLARAAAGEANAKIYVVGLASILHSLWGKTERYIQRIFDRAREQAPSIIFFDEIDAIARQRSSLNQAYSSIVNILLTNMDGMQERSQNVVVIGATNMLDLIDDALLRPGRFDLLIPVELPDDVARGQIFEIHMQKALRRATKPAAEIFDPNFDMTSLIKETKGYSGADIEEILNRAAIERVRRKKRGLELYPTTAQDCIKQISAYEQVRKDKASRATRGRLGFDTPANR